LCHSDGGRRGRGGGRAQIQTLPKRLTQHAFAPWRPGEAGDQGPPPLPRLAPVYVQSDAGEIHMYGKKIPRVKVASIMSGLLVSSPKRLPPFSCPSALRQARLWTSPRVCCAAHRDRQTGQIGSSGNTMPVQNTSARDRWSSTVDTRTGAYL